MGKRAFIRWTGVSILAAGFLLSGCGVQGEEQPTQNSAEQAQSTKAGKASADQELSATKNTTRIEGTNAEEIALSTSRMIWPATPNGTKPNVVLLAPHDNWQTQLVGLDLVHHPSDGPLLVTDKGKIADPVLSEIKRLHPKGAEDGTQVITIGMNAGVVKQVTDAGFKVKEIKGDTPEKVAAVIDEYYASVSGELPQSVVVSTSEQAEFAAPAGSWISHMPEPLLYVTKDSIPADTDTALKKRKGKANIYLLGPEGVISKKVESDLRKHGTVVRISGKDPMENAIAFAKYKDAKTGFGWGITKPGHGLVLASTEQVGQSLPALPFAHRGKHAPLLLTDKEKAPEALLGYLKELKPLFKNEPTEGPYNHMFIVGNSEWVSNEQQGDLDHLIEIEAANGMGHGDHGGMKMDNDQSDNMNHGNMNHGQQ
ncbi:hypothetical protein AM501_30565 [Aneurinibacillus migulanus]|uniref:cell wall-binding repeat-containing protein n=1 Tax=Aneurinibacillus migulanus TaxID=47500 RepID=UPI0005B8B7F5|nr:cell wall-binding repeat-containing protein [Aneurinibacillus migulanus]KIV53820.1 hypothetical protein TS64_18040 [Aneurinibacillus migulanus]KPD04625.1 hypothetical protein AM501_30565 [Aneurinibacillus migulanus]CEH30469.1 Transcriptional regulator [Aneurinibacillus migulanus]